MFKHSVAVDACKMLPLLADTNTRGSINFKTEWTQSRGSCTNVYRYLLGTHLIDSISSNPTDVLGIVSSIGVALQACKYDGVFDSSHQKISLCTNDENQDTNVRALTVAGRDNFCVPLKTMLATACTTLDATTTVEQCERVFEKYLEFSSGGSKQQPPIIVQYLEQALGLHVKSTYNIATPAAAATPPPNAPVDTDTSRLCIYRSNAPNRRSLTDFETDINAFGVSGSNFLTEKRRLILVKGLLHGVGRYVWNPTLHAYAYKTRRHFMFEALAALFHDVDIAELPATIDKMLYSSAFKTFFGVAFKAEFDEHWQSFIVQQAAQLYYSTKIGKTEFITCRRMSILPKRYATILHSTKLWPSYPAVLKYHKENYQTDFEEKAVVLSARIYGKDGPEMLGASVSWLRHFHRLMNNEKEFTVWEEYTDKILAVGWIVLEKIKLLPAVTIDDVPWPDELSYKRDAQHNFLCTHTSLKDLGIFCDDDGAWSKNSFAISDCHYSSVLPPVVGKGCVPEIVIQMKLEDSEYKMFQDVVIGDNPNHVSRNNVVLKRVVQLRPYQPKQALSLELSGTIDGTHISNLAGQRTGKAGYVQQCELDFLQIVLLSYCTYIIDS